MRALPLSFALIAIAAGHAVAQTAPSVGNAQAATKPAADGGSYSFPPVPDSTAGLAAVHLPEACGGGLLPADLVKRASAETACFNDLQARAKIAKANANLDQAQHPKDAVGTVGAPPNGENLVNFTNAVAGSAGSGSKTAAATPNAGGGVPKLLGGGCAQVCVTAFANDERRETIVVGQYVRA